MKKEIEIKEKIEVELTEEEWKYVWQAIILALERATEFKAIRKPYYDYDLTEIMYIRLRDKIWKQWQNQKKKKLKRK